MKHSAVLARGVSLPFGGKDLRSPATAGPFSLFVRPSPWERPLERRGLFAARQPAGFLLPLRSPQPPPLGAIVGFCAFCLSRTHPSRRGTRRTIPARCRSRETKARLKVARNGAGLLANPRIGARFER